MATAATEAIVASKSKFAIAPSSGSSLTISRIGGTGLIGCARAYEAHRTTTPRGPKGSADRLAERSTEGGYERLFVTMRDASRRGDGGTRKRMVLCPIPAHGMGGGENQARGRPLDLTASLARFAAPTYPD
jgi:hypothetical protein